MTREEAINELKYARAMFEFNPMTGDVRFRNDEDRRQAEALDMAIEALQTEPCEDCISRQAALECFEMTNTRPGAKHAIETLPSVQPEQKVIKCKDCNEWQKGKTHNGYDVCSDEGYCSVHRIITGENYYCGDAERR